MRTKPKRVGGAETKRASPKTAVSPAQGPVQQAKTSMDRLPVRVGGLPCRAAKLQDTSSAHLGCARRLRRLQMGEVCGRSWKQKLANRAEFEAHIDKAHLESFIWHVGDGPQNDGDSQAHRITRTKSKHDGPLPSYLYDAEGNQVTPSIRNQVVETEEERKERRRRLHRLWEQRDRNAADEEEEGGGHSGRACRDDQSVGCEPVEVTQLDP